MKKYVILQPAQDTEFMPVIDSNDNKAVKKATARGNKIIGRIKVPDDFTPKFIRIYGGEE